MKTFGAVAVVVGAALAFAFWKANIHCVTLYKVGPDGTWVLQGVTRLPDCNFIHAPAPEVLTSGSPGEEAVVTAVHNRYLRIGRHVTERSGSAATRIFYGRALFYGTWAGVALAPIIVWLVISLAVGVGAKPREGGTGATESGEYVRTWTS